jgi:catechol 2,3-dioxygenase-like lactoylglutathione lyase family enzyme
MAINRVVPNIQSAKAEESKAFYAETLGFDVAMDQGWIIWFASPTNPTAQIQVLAADATAPVVPALSIEVDDVDALYATVRARGYTIVYPLTDEPWGVRRFFTRDPQGLVVNIVSHRAIAERDATP